MSCTDLRLSTQTNISADATSCLPTPRIQLFALLRALGDGAHPLWQDTETTIDAFIDVEALVCHLLDRKTRIFPASGNLRRLADGFSGKPGRCDWVAALPACFGALDDIEHQLGARDGRPR